METGEAKGALTQIVGTLRMMEILGDELDTKELRVARAFLMIALAGDAGLERSSLVKAFGEAAATRCAQSLGGRGWQKDQSGNFKDGKGLVDIASPSSNLTVRVLTLTTEGKRVWRRVLNTIGGKK